MMSRQPAETERGLVQLALRIGKMTMTCRGFTEHPRYVRSLDATLVTLKRWKPIK